MIDDETWVIEDYFLLGRAEQQAWVIVVIVTTLQDATIPRSLQKREK